MFDHKALEDNNLSPEDISQSITNNNGESFANKQLKLLQSKYNLNELQIKILNNHFKNTEKLGEETQQKIKSIIDNLIQISKLEARNLPGVIQKIITDAQDNFANVNISSPLYIDIVIGGGATSEEIERIKQEKNKEKADQTTQKADQTTEKADQTTEKADQTTEKADIKSIEKKEVLANIRASIDNTDLSKVTIQYDLKILNSKPETKKALEVFKNALGYDYTPGEGLTGTELKKNREIEQKAIQYLNYHIALGKKVRQSEKNTSIKVSDEETRQSKEFINFLKESDIDPKSFYRSLGGDRKSFESKFEEKTVLNDNISSEKNNTSLSSNLGDNENIDIDSLQIDNVFKDIDNNLLLKKFPLPKNMKEYDFQYTSGSSEEFLKRIQTLVNTPGSYPFLEQSTKDWKTLVVAKKRLALYFILKNNNAMNSVPEEILKALYPSPSTDRNNWAEKLRGKLLNKSRSELMNEYEKDLMVPLMQNNFLNPKIEQSFSKKIKKGYLSSVSDLLSQTPELDGFSYNAQEIVMTNNLVKLPLYIKGQEKVDSYLTIENGKVYISNALYNPTDSHNVTQLTNGKVRIGQVKDFTSYAQDAIQQIPGLITTNSGERNPQLTYQEKFSTSIDTIDIVPSDESGYKESLQANIAHSLSQNKVRTSMKNVMYNRSSDGSLAAQDTKKSSPFFRDLENYESGEDKKITKENSSDTFDVAAMIRTNMLRNSASENIILKDSLAEFSQLIANKEFNTRVSIYLNDESSDKESPKYALFSLLDPIKRQKADLPSKQSLTLLLQLFGTTISTGPDAQNNRINTQKFQQAVDGLKSGVSFDLMNTDNLIASNNPLIEKINKQNGSIEGSFDQQFDTAYA